MEARHLQSALKILQELQYLTIATVCEDGAPWNTPVSTTVDRELTFTWGSNSKSQHSQNIERDGRAFGVLFDSQAPEGTGEGLYFSGRVNIERIESDDITIYSFQPRQAWINDEAKNDEGSYKYDVRVEIPLEALKDAFRKQ